jgi:DNA-directed RNA polymerase subunit RPC12/RpoP
MKKPYWLRRHISCPNCGFIIRENNFSLINDKTGFNCPNCSEHYSYYDFWTENHEKNGLGGYSSNEKIFSLIEEMEEEIK